MKATEKEELLNTLKERFEQNMNRHAHLKWQDIQKKLESEPTKVESLNAMEKTGGEPDVIGYDSTTNEFL